MSDDGRSLTTLYRIYDSRGRCLYIGITDNVSARFRQHRKSAWWREVADIDKTTFPTRAAAEAAERDAIKSCAPRYNVTHNEGRTKAVGQPPTRYVSMQEAADFLSVSTRTLRRYIASGRIRAYRQGPRLIRVALDDLENLLRPVPTVGTMDR